MRYNDLIIYLLLEKKNLEVKRKIKKSRFYLNLHEPEANVTSQPRLLPWIKGLEIWKPISYQMNIQNYIIMQICILHRSVFMLFLPCFCNSNADVEWLLWYG